MSIETIERVVAVISRHPRYREQLQDAITALPKLEKPETDLHEITQYAEFLVDI